LSRSRPPHV
jgi:hypothetical protein